MGKVFQLSLYFVTLKHTVRGKVVKLELIMAEPTMTNVRVVKDKKAREKKRRKPDPPRTNQRAMNMRRR